MANIVKLFRSIVSTNAPTLTQIQNYILGLNAADGILYFWNSAANTVENVKLRGLNTSLTKLDNVPGKGRRYFDSNQ